MPRGSSRRHYHRSHRRYRPSDTSLYRTGGRGANHHSTSAYRSSEDRRLSLAQPGPVDTQDGSRTDAYGYHSGNFESRSEMEDTRRTSHSEFPHGGQMTSPRPTWSEMHAGSGNPQYLSGRQRDNYQSDLPVQTIQNNPTSISVPYPSDRISAGSPESSNLTRDFVYLPRCSYDVGRSIIRHDFSERPSRVCVTHLDTVYDCELAHQGTQFWPEEGQLQSAREGFIWAANKEILNSHASFYKTMADYLDILRGHSNSKVE